MFREVRFDAFVGFVFSLLLLTVPGLTIAQTGTPTDEVVTPTKKLQAVKDAEAAFMAGPVEEEAELQQLIANFEAAISDLDDLLEEEEVSTEKDKWLDERNALLIEAAGKQQTATRGKWKRDKKLTLLEPAKALELLKKFSDDAYTAEVTAAFPEGVTLEIIFQDVYDLHNKYNITYELASHDNNQFIAGLVRKGVGVVIASTRALVLTVDTLPETYAALREVFNQDVESIRTKKVVGVGEAGGDLGNFYAELKDLQNIGELIGPE